MSSETGDAASSPSVIEPDPGCAVNVHGVAYDYAINGRERYTFLYAQKPNSTPLKREEWPVIKAGLLNAQELMGNEAYGKYLWVGLSPTAAGEATSMKKNGKEKEVSTIPYDEGALRVVVPVKKKVATQCKFYALVGGSKGLCETRCIKDDLVFYFPEFRTDATNIAKRGQEWNAKIRQAAVHSTSSNPAESSAANTFAKGINVGPRLDLAFELSLANEVQFFLAAYSITKEPWLLDHLSSVLERADPDLQAQPNENEHLCLFLESRIPLSMEEAEGVVTEATALRPNINITADSLLFMQSGLLGLEDVHLPYNNLLSFLALGHKRLLEAPPQGLGTAALQELIKTVVEDLALILPSPTNSSTTISAISPDMWQPLLTSLLSNLKELLAYKERYVEATASEVVVDSLDVIWKTLAGQADVDSCKMFANQVASYMHAAVNSKI